MHAMPQKSRLPNAARPQTPVPAERVRSDWQAHVSHITRSKESAVEFLQRAGILDTRGRLAKPYRD